MLITGPWQVIVLNEETKKWEVLEERETLGECEIWVFLNLEGEVLSGKTKGFRRKDLSVH